VAGALTLLVVLLVVLGGFLDGLEKSQTGAYRAHDDSVIVYDDSARRQLPRSRVPADAQESLAAQEGVGRVGTLDATFTVAGLSGGEVEDVILLGYDLSTEVLPNPPAPGSVVVDEQLGRIMDIGVGDVLEVGPQAQPLTVSALVDDVTNGAPSLWVSSDQWRELVSVANPGALPPAGQHQALVVQPLDSSPGGLVSTLRAADLQGLDPVTADEAIAALDVVQQQSTTFSGIIGVTFIITLMVIALFFALITLERVGLYAVLKAIGARTGELLSGVSVQALAISTISLVVGFGISLVFVSVLPPELPIRLEPSRLLQIAVGTLLTAVLGSLFTARRLLGIDPASAIG
jgi:putative ABC transport system permease protein